MNLIKFVLPMLVSIAFAACGGGGGGGDGGVPAITHSVSGAVTASSAALAGVTITVTGSATANTTTDANGSYTVTGLSDGAYAIAPSKSGYTFSPSSSAVNINAANVTSTNFVASVNTTSTYSVSGAVSGAVVSGVTVTLSGAGSATTATSGSGTFSFANLVNGNYTVTASKSGYTFSPSSATANVSGANIVNANFVASSVATSALANVDIVFNGGGDLNGMKVNGTGRVVLKKGAAFDGYDYFEGITFSPSGNKIAYAASCGGNRFIRVMSNDLGSPTDLTTRCSTGSVYSAYSPAFSPDGTKIAFIGSYNSATEKGNFLSVMNSDGTNQHRVSPIYGVLNPDDGSPSFSADGTRIVFDTCRTGGCSLATISLDGTSLQTFESCTVSGPCDNNHSLVPTDPMVDWSTNTIYYMSSNVNVLNNNWNLYKVSLTGTNKSGPLTSSASFNLIHPSVSPDGNKVVFVQNGASFQTSIQLLDLASGIVTTLTQTNESDPVFVRR